MSVFCASISLKCQTEVQGTLEHISIKNVLAAVGKMRIRNFAEEGGHDLHCCTKASTATSAKMTFFAATPISADFLESFIFSFASYKIS